MPSYRIVREVPEFINYRNGRLFFTEYHSGGKEWVWYVRRETVNHRSAKLCVAEYASGLWKAQKEGITVEKGSTQQLIFESLVRKGYAQRVPD